MRKLVVFNSMSLDGSIADRNGDMAWAHQQEEEWNSFVAANARGEGVLAFGRKTYDMMSGYWPTPMAAQHSPLVAKRMNKLHKMVFRTTMEKATWQNTALAKGELRQEVRRLRQQTGPELVILGSASIVSQLVDARLIDEYQIAFYPLVLGGGKSMFVSIQQKQALKLAGSLSFQHGNVLLTYHPA